MPAGFTQKDCLAAMHFHERDGAIRAKDGKRQAWKTGTRAEVGHAKSTSRETHGQKDRLTVVPLYDLTQVFDRGEV
jgi:hypothetical protein